MMFSAVVRRGSNSSNGSGSTRSACSAGSDSRRSRGVGGRSSLHGRRTRRSVNSGVGSVFADASAFSEEWDVEENELRHCLAEMSRLVERARSRTDRAVQRLKKQGRTSTTRRGSSDGSQDEASSSSGGSGSGSAGAPPPPPLSSALVAPLSESDAHSLAECIRRTAELAVEDEQRAFSPDRDEHKDLFGLTTELGGWKTILEVLSGEAFVSRDDGGGTHKKKGSKGGGASAIARARMCKSGNGHGGDECGIQDGVTVLPPASVAAQALRSLSYVVRNVVEPTSLFLLLSDRHLRSLVDWPLELYETAEDGNDLLAFHWGGCAAAALGGDVASSSSSSHQRCLAATGGGGMSSPGRASPVRRIVRDFSENDLSGLEVRFLSFLQSLVLRLDGDALKFFVVRPTTASSGRTAMFRRGGGGGEEEAEPALPLYDRALGFCGGGGKKGARRQHVPGSADLVRTTATSICLGVLRIVVSSARSLDDACNKSPSSDDNLGEDDDGSAAAMRNVHVLEAAAHVCRPSVASRLVDPIVRRIERTTTDLVALFREIDKADAKIASASASASARRCASPTAGAARGSSSASFSVSRKLSLTGATSRSFLPRRKSSTGATARMDVDEVASSVRAAAKEWREGLVEAARGLLTDLRAELGLVGEILKIGLTALNEQTTERILAVFSRIMWNELHPPPDAIFTKMRRRLTNEAPPNALLPLRSWATMWDDSVPGGGGGANPQGCSTPDAVEAVLDLLAPSSSAHLFSAPSSASASASSMTEEDLAPARAALVAVAVLFESVPPQGPLSHLAFVALFHPYMPSPDCERSAGSEAVEPRVATMDGGKLKFPRVLVDIVDDGGNGGGDCDAGAAVSCYDFGREERRRRARRRRRRMRDGRPLDGDGNGADGGDGRRFSYPVSASLADLMEGGTRREDDDGPSSPSSSSDGYAMTLLNHRRRAMVAYLSGNATRHRSVAVLRPWARLAAAAATEAVDPLVADSVMMGLDVTPSRAARLKEKGRERGPELVSASASALVTASSKGEDESHGIAESGDGAMESPSIEGAAQKAPPRGVTKKSSFPMLWEGSRTTRSEASQLLRTAPSLPVTSRTGEVESEETIILESVQSEKQCREETKSDPSKEAAPTAIKECMPEEVKSKNEIAAEPPIDTPKVNTVPDATHAVIKAETCDEAMKEAEVSKAVHRDLRIDIPKAAPTAEAVPTVVRKGTPKNGNDNAGCSSTSCPELQPTPSVTDSETEFSPLGASSSGISIFSPVGPFSPGVSSLEESAEFQPTFSDADEETELNPADPSCQGIELFSESSKIQPTSPATNKTNPSLADPSSPQNTGILDESFSLMFSSDLEALEPEVDGELLVLKGESKASSLKSFLSKAKGGLKNLAGGPAGGAMRKKLHVKKQKKRSDPVELARSTSKSAHSRFFHTDFELSDGTRSPHAKQSSKSAHNRFAKSTKKTHASV